MIILTESGVDALYCLMLGRRAESEAVLAANVDKSSNQVMSEMADSMEFFFNVFQPGLRLAPLPHQSLGFAEWAAVLDFAAEADLLSPAADRTVIAADLLRLDGADFIQALHWEVLLKPPSEQALEEALGRLSKGDTKEALLNELLATPDARFASLSGVTGVETPASAAAAPRRPRRGWRALLFGRGPAQTVSTAPAASGARIRRPTPGHAERVIDASYRFFLDREPDEAGRRWNLEAIASKTTTLGQVVENIRKSPEADQVRLRSPRHRGVLWHDLLSRIFGSSPLATLLDRHRGEQAKRFRDTLRILAAGFGGKAMSETAGVMVNLGNDRTWEPGFANRRARAIYKELAHLIAEQSGEAS